MNKTCHTMAPLLAAAQKGAHSAIKPVPGVTKDNVKLPEAKNVLY